MHANTILEVGLPRNSDIGQLGDTFEQLWPIEDDSKFDAFLRAIDGAQPRLDETSGT